jgi:broad specificity phosphatase PhoE
MRLFLVRHARTANNVNHVAQGHLDAELDEVGIQQAECLVDFFQDVNLSRVYSSDLKRCLQTAEPFAFSKQLQLESTPLLRERALGDLEGAPLTRLRKAFDEEVEKTGESRFRIKPCGAESAYEVMERAASFSENLKIADETVAIVTHGMMKEVLLCYLIGAPVESSRSFRFDNAAVTELRFAHNVWVLEAFNHTQHLARSR